MGLVWVIAVKDLALRVRDRSIIILGVIAPLVLAFVFNAVFGGVFGNEDLSIPFGVVDLDGGQVSQSFVEIISSLESQGLVESTIYESEADARAAIDAGEVRAAFVLPAGLSATATLGQGGSILVVGDVDAATSTGIASAIAERFSIGVQTMGVIVGSGLATGVIAQQDIPAVVAQGDALMSVAEVGDISATTRQLDPATYFVSGLSVYFMFFLAGVGTTSMLEERNDGTLARLLAAPISRGTILTAKALSAVLLALGSMTILVIASTIVMGADWGPPLGVLMLVAAAVVAAVAIMSVAGTFARTAEQAGNLQSIVATAFAMLGGTFVPISQDGGWLARLTLVTPNAWVLRGLGDMAGGGVADAAPSAAVLVGMALVAGAVGIPLSRRAFQR